MKTIKTAISLLLISAFILACSEGSTEKTTNSGTPQTPEKTSGLLYTDGIFLEVLDWGPRASRQGQLFNRQPDGSSAFWIKSENKEHDAQYLLLLDDLPLHTNNPANSPLISGGLTEVEAAKIVANPGIRTLSLLEKNKGLRQIVGEFLVE